MTLTDQQISEITHRLRERGADDDNIQDTFVKLLALPESPLDPVAWACKAALRVAIDVTRRQQTRVTHLPPPAETLDQLPPDRLLLLRERAKDHWKATIQCTHPDRPRYNKKVLNTCYPCYRAAWDAKKRG